MASQVTATPQMFMAPPTGSGGNSTTTMIIVLVVFVIFISMSVAAYFLFFKKEEGKECKIKDGDKNGVYKYDEDLDCVLDGCKKGYEVSGTKCITERKPGDSCFVTGGDSKGTYKLDAFKKCVLKSCTTGYKVENGKCVSTTPATTPASPSDVSGLIGHFIPSGLNVSGGVWNNQVSGKPDATVSGNVGVDGDAVWGEGGNGDDGVGGKVIFPQGATFGSTTGDYTMFYVGKYDEKDHGIGDRVGWAGRIFNSDNDQWLSGWHGGKVGVAWHYGWYTVGDEGQAYQGGKNDYILGTDAVNTFRLNGIDITTKENTTLMPANSKITINGGSLEFSSWKMKEILFYSRKLTTTEMKKVEDYLLVKHGIKRGKGVLSDTTVNAGWTNDFTNQLYGSYWTKSGGITYTADYGTPTTTMEDCRTEAATRNGVVAYGVRHGASGQKCWFLSGVGNPLGWADDTVASSNNGIHSIHCVDPDASVLNSCQ